jgi:Mg/Co/Ni transporter MgtE
MVMDEDERERLLSKLPEDKQREIIKDLNREELEDLVIELDEQRREYAYSDCREPGNLRYVLEKMNQKSQNGDNQSQ